MGEGKAGMISENSTEMYTLPYAKQITSGSLMFDTGHPKPVLCDKLEDGVGREVRVGSRMEGTHVCLWPIHVGIWQIPSQYCKGIILQLI